MDVDNNVKKDLSFSKLTALIIGSTIGGGIFTSAGDMAANGAHTGAVLIGWAIAGVGMLGLMMCFFGLNQKKPELTNGIYSYANAGFGSFIGFNSAWGYWISALLCNVSYTTLLFGAIGFFFPAFADGNNLLSICCASVAIWGINFLVLRGVKEAAAVNVITTISKIIPIVVFIIALIFLRAFDTTIFMQNFWGDGTVSLGTQVKATTASTVWSFIGVEGAVVLSGRAKVSGDVGKASMTGFLGLLAIYVMVAVLSMGVMPAEEMAALKNPQMAGILSSVVGEWGAMLVNIGVILSLAGALLGWTILAADCPFSAAQQGVFMKAFAKSNKHGSPAFSLFATNGIVQLFIIIIYFNSSTYQIFYTMSTTMIMIPYLFSALYYEQITRKRIGFENSTKKEYAIARTFAIIGSVYGIWMLYSSGLHQLLITSVLYALGIIIYAKGKKEKGRPVFEAKYEMVIAAGIVIAAVVSIVLIANGTIDPF